MRRSEQLREKLLDSLADAHELERELAERVDSMLALVDDETLERLLSWHQHIIWMHEVRLRARLDGSSRAPSMSDVLQALVAEGVDAARPARPPAWKIGPELYVMAHRQVAAYEQVRRLAALLGDTDTHDLAALHLGHAEQFADEVAEYWDDFVELRLDEDYVRPLERPSLGTEVEATPS